jgi:hypothetical protein
MLVQLLRTALHVTIARSRLAQAGGRDIYMDAKELAESRLKQV